MASWARRGFAEAGSDGIVQVSTGGAFHVGVITTSVYQHTFSGGIDFTRTYPTQSGKLQPVPDSDGDGGVILGTGSERLLQGEDPQLANKLARLVQQGTRVPGGSEGRIFRKSGWRIFLQGIQFPQRHQDSGKRCHRAHHDASIKHH